MIPPSMANGINVQTNFHSIFFDRKKGIDEVVNLAKSPILLVARAISGGNPSAISAGSDNIPAPPVMLPRH